MPGLASRSERRPNCPPPLLPSRATRPRAPASTRLPTARGQRRRHQDPGAARDDSPAHNPPFHLCAAAICLPHAPRHRPRQPHRPTRTARRRRTRALDHRRRPHRDQRRLRARRPRLAQRGRRRARCVARRAPRAERPRRGQKPPCSSRTSAPSRARSEHPTRDPRPRNLSLGWAMGARAAARHGAQAGAVSCFHPLMPNKYEEEAQAPDPVPWSTIVLELRAARDAAEQRAKCATTEQARQEALAEKERLTLKLQAAEANLAMQQAAAQT